MAQISNSVQFYGCDAVMAAYVRRGVPSWAIWHNRQFMFKCETMDIREGEEQLRQTLEMIAGSVATYTLCVHEKLQGGRITSKSEHDGSFNFQLNSRELPGSGMGNDIRQLLTEIRKSQVEQELRLAQLEEGEGEENVSGVLSGIKQVMEIPGVTDLVAGIFQKFLGKQAPAIAGIDPDITEPGSIDQLERERVLAAYAQIKIAMPDMLSLLEKLCEMSLHDRAKFDNLKNMFSTFIR